MTTWDNFAKDSIQRDLNYNYEEYYNGNAYKFFEDVLDCVKWTIEDDLEKAVAALVALSKEKNNE